MGMYIPKFDETIKNRKSTSQMLKFKRIKRYVKQRDVNHVKDKFQPNLLPLLCFHSSPRIFKFIMPIIIK